MKTRQEIKADAKSAMIHQRGTAILTLLVAGLLAGIAGYISGFFSFLFVFFPVMMFFSWAIIYASIFFVAFPLSVNTTGVFVKIYKREHATANDVVSQFTVNYLRKVGSMTLMFLFTILWSMLCFVPGIVKGISYSMTPYILANHPNVTARDAIRLSMRMTNGYKMDLFVMQLSFIGWHLLSILTCGVLSIVFVGPYLSTTTAGYFVELRDKALANGVIHDYELNGRFQ